MGLETEKRERERERERGGGGGSFVHQKKMSFNLTWARKTLLKRLIGGRKDQRPPEKNWERLGFTFKLCYWWLDRVFFLTSHTPFLLLSSPLLSLSLSLSLSFSFSFSLSFSLSLSLSLSLSCSTCCLVHSQPVIGRRRMVAIKGRSKIDNADELQ